VRGRAQKSRGCSTPVVYLYLDRLQLMLTGEGAARSKRAVSPAE
jgi:hypothetical protein